jgi:hypothetical protein
MPIQKITSGIIEDGAIVATDVADGSISNTKLSATGTANSSSYLRGDNTWSVVNLNSITGDLTVSGNATVSGTGFLKLPSGTTAQRPTSNAAGYIRHNTTLGYPEWYDANYGSWIAFTQLSAQYAVEYLVVAGGGGGGQNDAGGGGGGGFRTNVTGATSGEELQLKDNYL